jgi:hypothetical protein
VGAEPMAVYLLSADIILGLSVCDKVCLSWLKENENLQAKSSQIFEHALF